MCDSLGISDTKIQVYKVIDDETTPGGIVFHSDGSFYVATKNILDIIFLCGHKKIS